MWSLQRWVDERPPGVHYWAVTIRAMNKRKALDWLTKQNTNSVTILPWKSYSRYSDDNLLAVRFVIAGRSKQWVTGFREILPEAKIHWINGKYLGWTLGLQTQGTDDEDDDGDLDDPTLDQFMVD